MKTLLSGKKGKRWIVSLLAASCLAALILIITYEPPKQQTLRTTAELDSLIQVNLDRFRITEDQVRTFSVRLDTLEVRKIYTLSLPPGVSKTQWHYELDKLVRPYGVSTPARVLFPERNLRIHLAYRTNIVRTIQLRTGPEQAIQTDAAGPALPQTELE